MKWLIATAVALFLFSGAMPAETIANALRRGNKILLEKAA